MRICLSPMPWSFLTQQKSTTVGRTRLSWQPMFVLVFERVVITPRRRREEDDDDDDDDNNDDDTAGGRLPCPDQVQAFLAGEAPDGSPTIGIIGPLFYHRASHRTSC